MNEKDQERFTSALLVQSGVKETKKETKFDVKSFELLKMKLKTGL